MMDFGFYLEKGDVKKVSPDLELAKSLRNDMLNRANIILILDLKKFAKIIFENIYDSLRDFCDILLAIDGYKSYSHLASISYLRKYGFSEEDINDLDRFRYKRNSSKYYGKNIFFQDNNF